MNKSYDEVIESIKEGTFEEEDTSYSDELIGYDGYIITTSKREIVAGIDNTSSCCEKWGYITSHDNPSDFIGAKLLDVRITDSLLKTAHLPMDVYNDSAIFITFFTDKGDFQLVVYNEHNGYYSHSVVVKSNQLNYTRWL